jgi:hypothetical protein
MQHLHIHKFTYDSSYTIIEPDNLFYRYAEAVELNDGSLNLVNITCDKAYDASINAFFIKPNIKNKINQVIISKDASLNSAVPPITAQQLVLTLNNISTIGNGFTDIYQKLDHKYQSIFNKITIMYDFEIARLTANGGGTTKFYMKLTLVKPND